MTEDDQLTPLELTHNAGRWQRDMNEHDEIAKALTARLSELRTHLAEVERELHKMLPADFEEQAIELKIKKHFKSSKRPRLLKSIRLKPP